MRTLTTGLALGESPRWHEAKLWFIDMGTNEVATVDLDGNREVVATIPGGPMGIGWLPDSAKDLTLSSADIVGPAGELQGGKMLIVSSADGRLLQRDKDGTLTDHADLSTLDNHAWGDMVVDGRGNAYAGCIGFDFPGGEPGPGILALITPDGKARQVAGDLLFPNGVAVTPDQSTLIIAESYGHRLTAFDIAADGSLANRRVWAQLAPESYPDGICLDAEGAVWYADVPNRHCVRVREGGEVLQTIELDAGGFACALGGPQRSTLFAMVADWTGPESMMGGQRTGKVVAVEVDVPGVGWP